MSNIVQVIDGTVSVTIDDMYLGSVQLADYDSDYTKAIEAATANAEQAKKDYAAIMDEGS